MRRPFLSSLQREKRANQRVFTLVFNQNVCFSRSRSLNGTRHVHNENSTDETEMFTGETSSESPIR